LFTSAPSSEQLRAADCSKIYREKVTGARADRRELLKLPAAIVPGDVMTVTRIDRLARSTFDLFAIVKQMERDLIRTHTAEGRSHAKAQGQQMGRPPALHTGPARGSHLTPRGGRYARRTRPQLRAGISTIRRHQRRRRHLSAYLTTSFRIIRR